MSKDTIEGATQKTVGSVKETAGKVLHNDKLQAEGVADKVAGSTKETVGKGKDAIHDATK
ncbi:MAG: CsbD family protein [Caulobacteraceae bacterium]